MMLNLLRKIWRDRRGNIFVIAGAALPMVIGAAGLASDTIQWTLWKRQLQRAADSAAIAGVYDRAGSSGSTSTTAATVAHDLTLNLRTPMSLLSSYPQVGYPANAGDFRNQVTVTLAIRQKLGFSSLFLPTPPMITAVATAASVPGGGSACVQALETSASKTGIIISGNAAIYMPDCVMYSNSPATNSAYAKGSSEVTADAVAAVGGIQQSNNWHVGAYRPYSPSLADPFSGVAVDPAAMHCVGSTLDDDTNVNAVIASGTNCWSALSVQPNRSLTLPAGTYYINAGGVDIKGNLTCSGCTIVLTNVNTSPTATIGNFSTNASANINITAPTTGTFANIAIYQDRRAADGTNKINGNSNSIITGAVYFPSQELQYNGTGSTAATCTLLVGRRVNFTGDSSTSNKFKSLEECSYTGAGTGDAFTMVRLVG